MGGKGPRQVLQASAATKGPRRLTEVPAETSQHQAMEKITATINANLLQCCVCSGPLTPPLFQCTKGHVSCSRCCPADGYLDDEVECLMCDEPETATRFRAMEHILVGMRMPCPFRQHGCAKMIPYASVQAHKASCVHAPCHCPISGCTGYGSKPLREHIRQDHPGVVRTIISPHCLTPLRMHAHEQARMVRLGDSDGSPEFLVIVGQYKQLGRMLSVVRLVDESVVEQDFKHRIEVVGNAGVLSLSGETLDAERLKEPYKASPFLFVPNETWDSPEGIRVFIELK
ncbi:hypothetical protein BDA96_03G097400 [Sorghum bicolor]|nr:E3 ubiquitin-protein ligase SINA-like 7 isoform X2 [Sorghum bicolor]XP_021310734.1 E3 ubiquitin-protein ligase SINA-like 7 isoform X2 [Sorghum bicolor]XP_021310735.1 E3 ubiquitin-protein ligase SINA-like 7 isoform X2 [Sorghum bicolor]KAG0536847.1 hypothetical protein BDA96_03G097400 [Sorghum bicolor]KAG0536848.1 hypothetical protein BDA96_03G097400 [Sorghum bicolor]KXG32026.1 hypothetical protein SORBI_3003G092500 [Sorghum bicolor]KXG32027.1 hypothetical protein SORBI_3003G092500 [Sorghum |eukprot:XP_021310733.1 E3 ubiquitin-protein ligase SINA-like 7 isoform X2 [Sorghum bicolor]